MQSQTIGYKYNVGKIAQIRCGEKDESSHIVKMIKNNCFALFLIYEGSAYFRAGDVLFEANGPCFVCFDERENVQFEEIQNLLYEVVYFHPQFLNVNMSFERLHDQSFSQLAQEHDMFLLRPFTDTQRFVVPIFEENLANVKRLFAGLKNELTEQPDWYWSCRSRSFFMEMILLLERLYGVLSEDKNEYSINSIKNWHLRSAVIYIENHYYEDISLQGIARAASINHSTLTQLFKNELGMTAMDYLWRYRIRVACKHLAFTQLSVKEIQKRCGFKTIQHFCRKFEEIMGTTTTAYRTEALKMRKAAFE